MILKCTLSTIRRNQFEGQYANAVEVDRFLNKQKKSWASQKDRRKRVRKINKHIKVVVFLIDHGQ